MSALESRGASSLAERVARWRFVPHRRLRGGHTQTVAAALWRRRFHPAVVQAEAREVEVEPGSRVLVHCSWQEDRRSRPTLVVVHGLEGSSESCYILGTASRALEEGWNAVRLNMRNCGGTEHLTPTLYNSAMSGDLVAVLERLAADEGLDRLAIAAYSLGANLTLNMAGRGAPAAVRAIATVSPAVDLAASADALERPSNFLYQRRFVRSLAARLHRKEELFPGRYDLTRLRGMRSVRDYDDRYIAPLFGYRDAADYYERASAVRVLEDVRVPTLMLHAKDDPFVPFTDRIGRAAAANPLVNVALTERGGHVGFVSDTATGEGRHWAENRAVEFIREVLSAEC